MKIPVEISARHLHISKEDFEKLFGKGKELTKLKELSQPGEFASGERVVIVNGKRRIGKVRILGPFREKSQAEIALTDAYNLGLNPLPKIRISEELSHTPDITIKSQKSSIKVPCIIAQRHLHCSEEEARKLKLKNKQKVSIEIKGVRGVTFHNVIVRVSKEYKLYLHLDTDEGNSAGIIEKAFGEIV